MQRNFINSPYELSSLNFGLGIDEHIDRKRHIRRGHHAICKVALKSKVPNICWVHIFTLFDDIVCFRQVFEPSALDVHVICFVSNGGSYICFFH